MCTSQIVCHMVDEGKQISIAQQTVFVLNVLHVGETITTNSTENHRKTFIPIILYVHIFYRVSHGGRTGRNQFREQHRIASQTLFGETNAHSRNKSSKSHRKSHKKPLSSTSLALYQTHEFFPVSIKHTISPRPFHLITHINLRTQTKTTNNHTEQVLRCFTLQLYYTNVLRKILK